MLDVSTALLPSSSGLILVSFWFHTHQKMTAVWQSKLRELILNSTRRNNPITLTSYIIISIIIIIILRFWGDVEQYISEPTLHPAVLSMADEIELARVGLCVGKGRELDADPG